MGWDLAMRLRSPAAGTHELFRRLESRGQFWLIRKFSMKSQEERGRWRDKPRKSN